MNIPILNWRQPALPILLSVIITLTGMMQVTQPNIPSDFSTCGLHLTLTSGTAYTTADVTAVTNVFVAPVQGGRCGFYDGSASWTVLINAEVTVAVPATASTPFDVWCRNNAGTIACDTTNWTNDTTRATALAMQNNVIVKSGDTTRRYIGTGRTTTVNGQTEDSFAKRYTWSYYFRTPRLMRVIETTDSWTYNGVFRQARATATNQLDFVLGVAEVPVEAYIVANVSGNAAGFPMWVAIGEDSTTTADAGSLNTGMYTFNTGVPTPIMAQLKKYPAVGRHTWVWLEKASAAIVTWYGDNAADGTQSGIHGVIQG